MWSEIETLYNLILQTIDLFKTLDLKNIEEIDILTKEKKLKLKKGVDLTDFYEDSFEQYTYLS